MKRRNPPLWLCVVLLVLALCWRMMGAPVTAEQFRDLKTPLWQARVQLPSRLARILLHWQTPSREAQTDETTEADAELVNVYLVEENRLVQMTLEGYVAGVVAAEMPAQYHMEALKAQAAAARTRALWQKENGGCSRYAGADICTDSAHCQGYATPTECQERWGASSEAYRSRILQAQRETRGEVITYEGELITVLYHAISGGKTEDAAMVFSQSVPYLKSVISTGEESTRGFQEEMHLSYEEAAELLKSVVNLSPQELRRTLAIEGYTQSGRVKQLRAGSHTIEAKDFRKALGLRSTWFSLSMDETGITFQQRGYGHGVGMSQAGANSMAASGSTHAQILSHYYPGTVLEVR